MLLLKENLKKLWLMKVDAELKFQGLKLLKIKLSGFPLESWEILCFVPAKELFYL